MKSTLLAIGLATIAAAACGSAIAAENSQRELAPITVEPGQRVDCTPPSSAVACASLHAQIRAHFSRREIGVLFGARTSYPESLTSYARMNERYQAFVRDLAATGDTNVAIAAR